MLYSNQTIKNINSASLESIAKDKKRYFAVVGDNGILVTEYPLHATEGIMCLKNIELKEFSSELEAQKFAYSTYVQKYFTKYHRVPKNWKTFPTEYLWLSEHKSLKKSAHWITDYS